MRESYNLRVFWFIQKILESDRAKILGPFSNSTRREPPVLNSILSLKCNLDFYIEV